MSTAFAALVLGATAVGCATEEPEDKPYVPQITHSPQEPVDDENADEGEGVEPEISEDLENGGSELEPPEIPDEIYENTLEGAEATARYYYRAFEYGMRSYDTAPLELICSEASETCQTNIETIKRLKQKGRTYTGGELTSGEVKELISPRDDVLLVLAVVQEPAIISDDLGEIGRTDRYVGTSEFLIEFDGNQWKLTAIVTTEDET